MKNSNRLFSKALASLMLIGLCLCITSSLKASCPTDIHPTSTEPGYVAWIGPLSTTIFNIAGTTCSATVTYCQRTVTIAGVVTQQMAVETITPDVNCGAVLWSDILAAVREGLFQLVPADPCGHGVVTVATVFMASCSELEISPFYVCKFCPGAWCAKTCQLCFDPATEFNIKSNCTYTQIGTADCPSAPDGWPNLSVSVTAYNLLNYPSTWVDHCFLSESCSN